MNKTGKILAEAYGIEVGQEFKIGNNRLTYKFNDQYILMEKRINGEYNKSYNYVNGFKPIIQPEFTDTEITILKASPNDYRWITRDENEFLYVSKNIPFKYDGYSFWNINGECGDLRVFNHLFQSIKWEDEQPFNFREYLEGLEGKMNEKV